MKKFGIVVSLLAIMIVSSSFLMVGEDEDHYNQLKARISKLYENHQDAELLAQDQYDLFKKIDKWSFDKYVKKQKLEPLEIEPNLNQVSRKLGMLETELALGGMFKGFGQFGQQKTPVPENLKEHYAEIQKKYNDKRTEEEAFSDTPRSNKHRSQLEVQKKEDFRHLKFKSFKKKYKMSDEDLSAFLNKIEGHGIRGGSLSDIFNFDFKGNMFGDSTTIFKMDTSFNLFGDGGNMDMKNMMDQMMQEMEGAMQEMMQEFRKLPEMLDSMQFHMPDPQQYKVDTL